MPENITKKTLTCIVCPIGCKIDVTLDEGGKILDITGNTCRRGYKYAETEFTNPTRTLTSTVRCDSEFDKLLPVRTSAPIPKGKLFDAMKLINQIEVRAPISRGDVVCADFIEPGINLIACKNVK